MHLCMITVKYRREYFSVLQLGIRPQKLTSPPQETFIDQTHNKIDGDEKRKWW